MNWRKDLIYIYGSPEKYETHRRDQSRQLLFLLDKEIMICEKLTRQRGLGRGGELARKNCGLFVSPNLSSSRCRGPFP